MKLRAIVLACLAGCGTISPYYCSEDADCYAHQQTGTCIKSQELCAFPDTSCPSTMLRYDDSAGDLSGMCVASGSM